VERRQPGAENGLTMEGEHLKVYEDRWLTKKKINSNCFKIFSIIEKFHCFIYFQLFEQFFFWFSHT
jgi:hypothetical protein